MKTINKIQEPKIYYVVSKNNQTEFIRPYHDYYGSWTSDIDEAEHKYLMDAFSMTKSHGDYEVLKVTETLDKYNIEKVTKDSPEVKQELFESFLDICLTYEMKDSYFNFIEHSTGLKYPKNWINAFKDIKKFTNNKLKELAESEGIDYELD